MADEKKKKKEEPKLPNMHEIYDAKATLSCGDLILWALRDGKTAPASLRIMRKNAQPERLSDGSYREPGFSVNVAELDVLIAVLKKFKDETLPKLEKYGEEPEDEE